MKLDRNTNPDGAGKYGLVKVRRFRELTIPEKAKAATALRTLEELGMVEMGPKEPGDQFFVMRYKDKFTASGLLGYARAVEKHWSDVCDEIDKNPNGPEADALIIKRDSLKEYLVELEHEAARAINLGNRIPD